MLRWLFILPVLTCSCATVRSLYYERSPPPKSPIVAAPAPAPAPVLPPSPTVVDQPPIEPQSITKEDVVCRVLFKVVFTTAEILADSLGCIDVQAIASDLGEPIVALDLCSKPKRGKILLGPVVCPVLSSLVVEYATKKLPTEWQCSGGYATVYARKQIAEACLVAFPF